jgi:hypothetical protein
MATDKTSYAQRFEEMSKKWNKNSDYKKSEYIAAIIFNLIFIYIANNLLDWDVPFLTSDFTAVLWLINISLVLTIIFNIVFLAFNSARVRALLKMFLNMISFFVALTFYFIYPLDFSSVSYGDTLDLVAKILIIIGIVGSVIGTIAEFAKIFTSKK